MPLWSPTIRKNSRGLRTCDSPTGPNEALVLLRWVDVSDPEEGFPMNHFRQRPVLRRLPLLTGLLLTTTLCAQFDPEGAQVISYFPQLADGGDRSQQWVTSLTFVNPHFSLQAFGTVNLFGDDGSPLALNFGKGAVSTFTFAIPAQGSVTFTTTGGSPTTVTGWAIVFSSLPLEGVVQFQI